MSAREEVLRRIGAALGDRPAAAPIPRDYRQAGATEVPDLVELLTERLVDYRATVNRCAAADLVVTIGEVLGDRAPLVVPDGLPAGWLAGREVRTDDPQLSLAELDSVAGVVTSCAVAIALTGTIVLDHGPGQGRRALSLVPDYHLAVVRTDQIVANVPDAIAVLDPIRPMTWISGPSATSDIELNRVEGVHGPRTLDVLIVGS